MKEALSETAISVLELKRSIELYRVKNIIFETGTRNKWVDINQSKLRMGKFST